MANVGKKQASSSILGKFYKTHTATPVLFELGLLFCYIAVTEPAAL